MPYCSIVDHLQLIRLLLNEKVISVDTTAAGGNATSLNAAGRDEGLNPFMVDRSNRINQDLR